VSRGAAAALAVLACAACGAPAGPGTCADDLQGVYTAPDGARWMVLDNRREGLPSLEVYPLFPDAADVVAPAGVVVAPRVIDLRVAGARAAGDVLRRYTRGGDACTARAPVHVTACTPAGLELVLADPAAPLGFAPCVAAPVAPSRREVWARE
jgi:hypothetical protein